MTSGLRIGFVRRGRCVPRGVPPSIPLERTDLVKPTLAKAGAASDINVTQIKAPTQIKPGRFRNPIGLKTELIRLRFMLNFRARNPQI
jgi:hypothetical protein